ncbi:MAG: sugar ABC transporter substrate-binding protein [Clostridiales bacterium]|nr:extracellular solute-binding protein [Clostridiales bacterium]PWM42468.1 MAG: sugar ABC transporter substrate-binding protein [Clostridiales bacterium]
MKKRILAALLSALLVAALATSCDSGTSTSSAASAAGDASEAGTSDAADAGGDSDTSGGVIELEFFQQQGEEAIQAGYEAVIADFEEEYPNIKITQNTVPDAAKVLTSRIATDDCPPVLTDWPTQMQFKEKVKNGYYEKLSDQPFFDQINESYLAMTPADDGEYYAMPYASNYMAVFYNIDIFEENNIEIPSTWDEFIAVCDQFVELGITPLNFPLKDGVGHIFQATTVAFLPEGIEQLEAVQNGEAKLAGNEDWIQYGNMMLKLMEYGNSDAFGMSTTNMQEAFANGQCAMIISGSYGRGNIILANPDLNFGAFVLPGLTEDTTNCLTGVNAAQCISASASDEEKEAALTFLSYLARTEVAQKWSDETGEPSIIKGTAYADANFQPVLDFINGGQVHDWMASTLDNNVVNEMYNTVQSFLLDKPSVDVFLENMDTTIEIAAQ